MIRTAKVGVLLLVIVLVAGCPSVRSANQLREAQDAFSRGAEIENELARQSLVDTLRQFAPGTAAPQLEAAALTVEVSPWYGDALVHYGLARDILAGIDEAGTETLERDGLLPLARTLMALAAWKTGDHPAALAHSRAARELDLDPRDRVLMEALPGILIVEETRAALAGATAVPPDDPEAFFELHRRAVEGPGPITPPGQTPRSALQILSAVRAGAGDHPIRILVIHHELSAYQALQELVVGWGDGILGPERVGEARSLIERLGEATGSEAAGAAWKLALGILRKPRRLQWPTTTAF